MELFAMNKFIKSEDHHITEELVTQLHRDSQLDVVGIRGLRRGRERFAVCGEPWFSFYDQLDKFYEACLLNKIQNDTNHYFYARKMTVNECIAFKKSYQSHYSRRYDHTWRKYQKKLYKFEEDARYLWKGEELFKRREKSYQISFDSLSNENTQIEEARKHSEVLDHQLFHGRRMTIEFTCNNDSSITEQLNNIMENYWSTEHLSASNRILMRLFKDFIRRIRRESRLDWRLV